MITKIRLSSAALLLLACCAVDAADRLKVYAVNYPLAYFAQRIGAEHVDLVFPVPADVDPAFWQPDASDIAGFQQADLILLNGADYAKWLQHASLPRRRLINTSAAFSDHYISVMETITHQHGPGGEHSHAGTAFTTWLDFTQAVQQALAIKNAMIKKLPEQAETFTRNFQMLERELNDLDQALAAVMSQNPGALFVASHPVYQYLARRYGIKLESVMWEPEVIPDQVQWRALEQQFETHHAQWMIWEGQPGDQSVKRLRAMGVNSLVFEPCANIPDEGDFISVMKSNIMELDKALSQ